MNIRYNVITVSDLWDAYRIGRIMGMPPSCELENLPTEAISLYRLLVEGAPVLINTQLERIFDAERIGLDWRFITNTDQIFGIIHAIRQDKSEGKTIPWLAKIPTVEITP